MKNYNKKTLKIYSDHVKKYKVAVFLIAFSVIGSAIIHNIIPLFYKKFFDILSSDGDISSRADNLIDILLQILALNFITWILWRIATFISAYFQPNVVSDLYRTCFDYLHKHSVSFFNNNFVGSLVKKVGRFSNSFHNIADTLTWELLPTIIDVILIIAILSYRNILFGIVVTVWLVLFCLISYAFSKYKLKYDFQRSALDSKVTAHLADTITNQSNVKIFSGYSRERSNFNGILNQWRDMQSFTWNLSNYFDAAQALFMLALEIGMFYAAVLLWKKGLLTVGDFVLIQVYLTRIFMIFWGFGRTIRNYYSSLADANEMTEILETAHEIEDVDKAKKLVVKEGKIDFTNVSFSYRKTREIISGLNLTINPQEKIALVGHSGSGKSTIVNLLLRNHDVSDGKIMIDGQEIAKVKQESVWDNISVVSQDSLLFHRSIKENIRYAKPNATDEEIIEAAKKANAHQFISNFAEGYDTLVGERGVKLSGGERQRVAIARAIIKDAPILVLDEATSSLDSESEQLIQQALETLMKNRTVIVVAHRLSTIMRMDRAIVLENGKIIEQGAHQDLIKKKGGKYKSLWEKQVGGFIG